MKAYTYIDRGHFAYRVFESRAEGVIKIAVPSINGVSPGIISF